MAQPIRFTPPSRNEADSDEHIRQLTDQHAEAIASALDLLQRLHDRGVLNLLRGMVGAGDQLVGTLAAAVDTPEAIRAIRNFILLTKFFAGIPPDVLSSLVQTVEQGAEREKAHRAPGLLQLLSRMRSEDTRHALAVALDLVEGLGRGL